MKSKKPKKKQNLIEFLERGSISAMGGACIAASLYFLFVSIPISIILIVGGIHLTIWSYQK